MCGTRPVVTEVWLVWKLLPKGHFCLSRSALVCRDVPWTWGSLGLAMLVLAWLWLVQI